MKICQKLYEEGYITYMRTDSIVYSDEFKMKAAEYITKKYGFDYNNIIKKQENLAPPPPPQVIVKKDGKKLKKPVKESTSIAETSIAEASIAEAEDAASGEECAHEAIRPTDITFKGKELDTKEFSNKEIRMYDLIRNHTLESCMAPATYKAFTASVSAATYVSGATSVSGATYVSAAAATTSPEKKEYKYSTEKVVFLGWKIVRYAKEEDSEDSFTYLQTLKNGSILQYKKITAKETIKDLKSHYTEARLVQLLEQQGIGRPSTFSSLIEKIQDREYVKKTDVKGMKIKCVDYELEGEELSEIEIEREFGNEKNKLVIQPAGMLVIEFLLKHYESLFQYAYTKQMEDTLDLIAKGMKVWHELCGDCYRQIESLTSIVQTDNAIKPSSSSSLTEEIKIDEEHTYMIAKYGPVIKYTPLAGKGLGKGKVKKLVPAIFKPLRHDIEIDLDKLRKGEYKLEDILATEESQRLKFTEKQEQNLIGLYKEQKVYFKTGKYGPYIECGDIRKSVKTDSDTTTISLADAIKILETISKDASSSASSSVVRKITEDLSIRKGQYGDYIFYKKQGMKTPKFFKLTADFDDDYKKCDVNILKKWIKETYGV